MTAVVTGYDAHSLFGYDVCLYLENKSENPVMFSVDKESIDGYMIPSYWAHAVAPGKAAFAEISFSDSSLEENSIDSVEEIEFEFYAYNDDNWEADRYFDETVTLNP